jgi:hypothetical protein
VVGSAAIAKHFRSQIHHETKWNGYLWFDIRIPLFACFCDATSIVKDQKRIGMWEPVVAAEPVLIAPLWLWMAGI